jgi:hypothetical protein
LLLRTIKLIRKNLHEDYHLEYKADLDNYLAQVNSRRQRIHLTFDLPAAFETE